MRKFRGLIPTFVEVTGEKLVAGLFAPPPILNRVNIKRAQASQSTSARCLKPLENRRFSDYLWGKEVK